MVNSAEPEGSTRTSDAPTAPTPGTGRAPSGLSGGPSPELDSSRGGIGVSDSKNDPKNATSEGPKDPIINGVLNGYGTSPAELLQTQQGTLLTDSPAPMTCTPDNPTGQAQQPTPQMGPWDGKQSGPGQGTPPAQVMEQISGAPIAAVAGSVVAETLGAAYIGAEIIYKTYEYLKEAIRGSSDDNRER
ncbi:hypothetical protein LMG24238_04501 [Paraburkholderia sediminicola]|uniref:Uncharacterized protein n=1 Tax=Paraburkholderia sediminicola TaxID=458836 RepID=A0A6J5BV87_9BURK|nr:hypothetical protein LMG24238_04501 [Paraburkholderia sediminicola]